MGRLSVAAYGLRWRFEKSGDFFIVSTARHIGRAQKAWLGVPKSGEWFAKGDAILGHVPIES